MDPSQIINRDDKNREEIDKMAQVTISQEEYNALKAGANAQNIVNQASSPAVQAQVAATSQGDQMAAMKAYMDFCQANNAKEDDEFFLFRWIREYGCYMGAAALIFIVACIIRNKFWGNQNRQAADNLAMAHGLYQFITGK